jgi:hypothetical protein
MQVMVGCGTVCSFHVGGAVEGSLGDQKSVRRWEFFIGDCPHATGTDALGRRQPMAQISQAEKHAKPCQVVISAEVASLVQGSCTMKRVGDDCFRLEAVTNSSQVPPPPGPQCTHTVGLSV